MGKEIKNIIVLRNVHPKMFEEVIFVLKKDAKTNRKKQTNLVQEAKKIVNDYIRNHGVDEYSFDEIQENNTEIKNNKINMILNISLILSIILFVMLLIKIF